MADDHRFVFPSPERRETSIVRVELGGYRTTGPGLPR